MLFVLQPAQAGKVRRTLEKICNLQVVDVYYSSDFMCRKQKNSLTTKHPGGLKSVKRVRRNARKEVQNG